MKTQLEMTTNPNAKDWTEYFFEHYPNCNVDEDVMFGWFANAMMAMHDHCKGVVAINGDHAAELMKARGE